VDERGEIPLKSLRVVSQQKTQLVLNSFVVKNRVQIISVECHPIASPAAFLCSSNTTTNAFVVVDVECHPFASLSGKQVAVPEILL
jgi:hypothetical protein